MWYRIIESQGGGWIKDGVEYELQYGNEFYTPYGLNAGFDFFESEEEAIKHYGVTKIC